MELKNLESFTPRECISGKMMRLNRVTANIFRKYLKPYNITDSQLTLLFILTKRDNLNQKELSDIVLLEKSSLNRNLSRLIEAELVSKKDFPLIRITQKGKILVNSIIPEWQKAMSEIVQILGVDGIQALNIITTRLLN